MKLRLFVGISISKTTNDWELLLLPTITITRRDVLADEFAHYIIAHWLIFQVYLLIRTKKKIKQ